MKKPVDVKLIILGELVLLMAVLFIVSAMNGAELITLVDLPSLIGILILSIPGLLLMGQGKNFLAAFSLGKKHYSLMELKNIVEAVSTFQKLIVYSGILEIVIGIIAILRYVENPELLGPNIAVAILSVFYMVILEFLVLPLRVYAVNYMNKEMDMEYED